MSRLVLFLVFYLAAKASLSLEGTKQNLKFNSLN